VNSLNTVPPLHVEPEELRVVDRAAAGDSAARRALFEQHREAAYRTALRITRREEDALDVVQDSFIRAFDRLAEFQRESGFRTWLLRIVANRALDVLRTRKVRQAVPLDPGDESRGPQLAAPDTSAPPGQELERQELAQRLRQALEALPADQRAVFALYATGEMTYGEIAAALEIPIGTVMSRLYHARRRLFEILPDLATPGVLANTGRAT
jgi:RNA polymerase sigma-70 factor (ECF subfamily)